MSIASASGEREKEKSWLSDSAKLRKSNLFSSDHFSCVDETNDRLETSECFSSLGIHDIVSFLQLANSKGRNLSITADEGNKKANGLFPSVGLTSILGTDESENLPRKAAKEGNDSMNLHASLNGKVVKMPMEHDDTVVLNKLSGDQVSANSPTQEPCDGGTTQDKSNGSKQNGSQKVSGGGSPVAGICNSRNEGRPNSTSSGGGGGGGDDRRPNVPVGGCQSDRQCDVEGKQKQRETEKEEQKCKDDANGSGDDVEGDVNDDDDDDDIDDGSDKIGGKKEEERSGCSLPEAAGNTQEHIKQPCGSLLCLVSEDPAASGNGSGHQRQWGEECHREPSKPVDGAASKSSYQGLKLDVEKARSITQAGLQAACQMPLHDQISCQYPQATDVNADAETSLQQAFACRRNMRAWEKCSHVSCQAIQQYLAHTHNCHMRVLGGCVLCIQYKDILLLHALRCKLHFGECFVEKCDDIRRFMETNSIPDNRKWTWQLDWLFFKASPPRSPTLHEPCLAEDEPDDQEKPTSFFVSNQDSLTSSGNATPFAETLSRGVSGVWNQYHVDRPPDLQVFMATRGPAIDNQVSLQQHAEDEESMSAAPLSAACKPDVAGHSTTGQEVIWPLNTECLSVGEDGSYIKNVHWIRLSYIGGGSCGRCYLCADIKTECLFAIKQIPETKFEMTEIQLWGSLSGRHPNILDLYGAVKTERKITIFMEYMDGGSVEDVGKMCEDRACHIFWKVLSAVEFIHSEGMIHRDLKGGNILVDHTYQKVKLADFGTSIMLSNGYHQDNTPQGTEAFMPPEVCRSEPHSFSADIWSLMCALYQMLTGVLPWKQCRYERYALLYQIGAAEQPPSSPPCSPELEDLFNQGFQLEPTHRATARELLKHRVFVAAPDNSNIILPSCSTGYDRGYDSSHSSLISGAGESLVSDHGSGDGEDDVDDEDNDEDDVDDENDDDEDDVDDENDDDEHDVDDENDDDEHDVDDENDDGDDDVDDEDDDDVDDDSAGQEGPPVYVADADQWQRQQEQDFLSLSAEQQLQSLQMDLFQSLSGEDLQRLVLDDIAENSSLNDNDVNLLSSQDDFDFQSLIDQINMEADTQATADWSYSMTDLTKLHFKDSEGNLMFTIRERPTTSYGSLGKDHHGNIASLLRLDAFALTSDDCAPLDVHAEIGEEEQAVRVVRAHDTDNWGPYRWRVDVHGLVEQWMSF